MSFFESDQRNKLHCKHQPRVDVKETIKVSEILDPYGNLRYKVALTSFDLEDDGKYILKYEVQVINYFSAPNPLIIIDRPEEGEPPIYDYCYALKLYNEYVKTYTSLVRAETRDFQDIEVYKEKIGYKKTNPACCATCKWCRKKQTPGQFIHGDTGKLECINPKNTFKYNNDIEDFNQPIRHCKEHWFKRQHQCDCQHIELHPNVDPLGICEHYLLKIREQVPVPGQNITEFIDLRLGQRLDEKIEKVFENTLSSNTMTISMANAISNVFTTSETSSIVDIPLAGMISADATSKMVKKVANT